MAPRRLADHRRQERVGDQENVVQVDAVELVPQLRVGVDEVARMP